MKRLSGGFGWLGALLVGALVVMNAWGAGMVQTVPSKEKVKDTAEGPGLRLAQAVTAATGVAISPLLGVSVVGAWQWMRATPEQRPSMSWYTQPWFWLCGLLLVGLVAAKDVAGAVIPPGMKKPFDVAESFEGKVSGLVAAGALFPMMSSFMGGMLAAGESPFAGTALAAIDWNTVQAVAIFPFALAAYGVVWLASHAITILILLSPWGVVDIALKSLRGALLALVAGVALINPWVGAALSVLTILVAYRVAGWSFRLLIFGWVFGWDFVTRRYRRFKPQPEENWCFLGQPLGDVPVRTYGRLGRDASGRLRFRYRRWLFGAAGETRLPEGNMAVGNGFFFPTLVLEEGDRLRTLIDFPPRYRTHEEALAAACRVPVRDVGLLASIRKVSYWLRELFGLAGPVSAGAS